MSTVAQVFEALQGHAIRAPGSIALASRTGYMTYEDLVGNIASAAVAAARNGIRAGQLVALACANADAQLIVALALLRIGCRVGYSGNIELYDASGVPVDAVVTDAAPAGVKRGVVVIDAGWFRGAAAIGAATPEPADDSSLIFSSSGSTGRPKLIEVRHKALLHWIWTRKSDGYLRNGPRMLSAIGDRNAGTFLDTASALINGGMAIRPESGDPGTIVETMQLFQPDYLLISPSTLVDVLRRLDERPAAIDKVRWLRATGSYCAPVVRAATLDRLAEEFVSTYGSNETGRIALGYSKDIMKTERSVGRVIDSLEIAAFDDGGQRLPDGSVGAIRVKPPEGTLGTYPGKETSGQESAIRDGWFATGDIGRVDAERNLIILGRVSNVINIGGSKISPEVLEEEIRTFSQVRDVGVSGVDRPEGFEEICAAIVSNTKLTIDDVNAHLRRRKARLPVQKVKIVQAIPRTESGKIDRVALRRICSDAG